MHQPQILIAEDDAIQGAVLRAALQGRGYAADIVTDGLEAVRRLRTGRYDLALLDYNIPDVDGFAAARLLHDLLHEAERPQLIAISAGVEQLNQRGIDSGSTPFDSIVCKRGGLPALLTVIDANLATAAERRAEATLQSMQDGARTARHTTQRRMMAPLVALPGLAAMAVFATALGIAAGALHQVDGVEEAAGRMQALSVDANDLVNAVQDTELSQRSYLATGAPSQRQRFEADAEHVDHLLVDPAMLSVDGQPAQGDQAMPRAVIAQRLQGLAAEAKSWPRSPTPPLTDAEGRAVSSQLRTWGSSLVTQSHQAVATGLVAIRQNIGFVLPVLGLGVLYGLWNAVTAVRRWLRRTGPSLRLRVASVRPVIGPRKPRAAITG